MRKLKKKKTHKKVSYEDLIKNMDEFKKDVELSYERPIKEVKDNNDSIFEVEKNEFEDESIDSDEKTDKELLDQNIFDESELTEEEISEEINNKLSASTIDAEKLTESFVNFLANFQITTSYKSIKQLFASLPASKILYIKSNDLNKLEIFVNALQAYTDSPNITLDLKDMESFTDLIKDFNSSFVKLLIEASKNKNKVHFVYIKDIKKEKFERLLAPFIVINRSNSNISINIDKKIIPISKNIYFIIPQSLGKENDESVTIDINLADAQKEEYLGPLEPLNINSLLNVINEYQEEVYVSEEDFKKFDDLFDELSTDKQLSLSNRSTLDFDKIYLLLIFAGLDKSEAIDILLRERIVPQLKKLNIYKNNKPELLKTVIRIFGEDNIALSLKELRDSEVDNNE